MDETILLPSPNWFLVMGMAVSKNGWIIYGAPTKSICILEPLPPGNNIVVRKHNGYRAHVFGKAHREKVTSVDICPAWPEKKYFLTGAADGTAKQWLMENEDGRVHLKSTHNHTLHAIDQEEVVAVGYCTNDFAVTVGVFGRIVKWDLQSNIIKTYDLIITKFKPTCIACSAHVPFQVALGTKQGVVLVVDISDAGKILYKVRCHDDEVLSLSWCPQYTVPMKTLVKKVKNKSANDRMEKIRQDANKEESEQLDDIISKKLDDSATTKSLPEDSFDETIVEEEDLFDVYKDPEEHEFGHKKYTPEVIVVKEQDADPTEFDYLAECQKLKEMILKSKEPEPSISSLVDALENTHVNNDDTSSATDLTINQGNANENVAAFSEQSQHHLLASIGKHGTLRIWNKFGRLLGTAVLQNKLIHNKLIKYQKVNQPIWATLLWYKPDILLITDARGQLLQCNPLTIDSRNKVIDLGIVDAIHKRGTYCMISNAPRVQYGYGGADGDRVENENVSQDNSVQTADSQFSDGCSVPEDEWFVWTAAQDRTLVCYSLTNSRKVSMYYTCGSLVYNIQPCPYDAKRMVLCVGDGAVRLWDSEAVGTDGGRAALAWGRVTPYWQNVQGKVLVAAWHPNRENLLAFGTAESRVGILDLSGSAERAARVLNIGVTGSVYSLSWGERNDLYVCGGADIIVYRLKRDSSKTIAVELEGTRWRLTSATWYPTGLICGSYFGAVAVLCNTTYEIQAVNFVFKKSINSIEWHPQYTSSCSEESSLKNLIAVSSMDKCCNIAILKYTQDEDGKHHLVSYKHLEGHKGLVLQLAWSPHEEALLASTSNDRTVRVWDVVAGACTAVYAAHAFGAVSVAWSAYPQLARVLCSGGADCAMRVWRADDHPPEAYQEPTQSVMLTKKERLKRARQKEVEEKKSESRVCNNHLVVKPNPCTKNMDQSDMLYGEGQTAGHVAYKMKAFKRFLLPICSRQLADVNVHGVKKLARRYIGGEEGHTNGETDPAHDYDLDYLKLFGTTNEFNEVLDMEMANHLALKELEAWVMLALFRGQFDAMIQFANKNDMLCPFLVSIAPSVSFKYWKDVMQLYLAQMNRFISLNEEDKLLMNRSYGGPVFRRAAMLLSVHDVRGAVDCLAAARLYREAYVLCRARHMDSIAQETLWQWQKDCVQSGHMKLSVICCIALGDLKKATITIAGLRDCDEEWLSLAADLAKVTGQHTYAGHLEDVKDQIKQAPKNEATEKILEELPSRIELLLKNMKVNNESDDTETKD